MSDSKEPIKSIQIEAAEDLSAVRIKTEFFTWELDLNSADIVGRALLAYVRIATCKRVEQQRTVN